MFEEGAEECEKSKAREPSAKGQISENHQMGSKPSKDFETLKKREADADEEDHILPGWVCLLV
jgi:hypothetical protein